VLKGFSTPPWPITSFPTRTWPRSGLSPPSFGSRSTNGRAKLSSSRVGRIPDVLGAKSAAPTPACYAPARGPASSGNERNGLLFTPAYPAARLSGEERGGVLE
jgi:hypothetical protein